jgi:hypothetical protein
VDAFVSARTVLALSLIAAGLLLLYAGRHLSFFYDEWTFIFQRRGDGVHSLLAPHNGHLVLFSVLVYKLLFALVGLRHYIAYRAVDVALHLLCCALLYSVIRRRLGPWGALVPTGLLLFLGAASQVLLWPFQISYLASVAGGLAALLLLERRDRPRDWLAAAALTWSVISSGIGLAFIAACAIMLVAGRDPARRLWVVAVPLIVFGVWYLGWGASEPITTDSILGAPQYVATAAAGASAGLAALDQAWGRPLLVALAGLVALAWQRRAVNGPTPMFLAAVGGALTFWTLAAITRADSPDPTASRYLYIGVVFILLVLAEARVGIGIARGWQLLAGILVIGAIASNLQALRNGERGLRASTSATRASLGAMEVAAPVVGAAFEPDRLDAPQVTAGQYLAAVRQLGSPALTVGELQRAPEAIRERADAVLVAAEQLALTTPVRLAAIHAACAQPLARVSPPAADSTVRPGTRLFLLPTTRRTPVRLQLRRFADQYGQTSFAQTDLAGNASLRFPQDRAPSLPWHVRVSAAMPVRLCLGG